ncbi:TRAP-type mannitol/chloroaromatic compound transport system, periplasmic component [Nostoc sp. PCC 7524]|uniref:TRAP transporter substrate-binding protein n=1 Tax=Nostoc sp. (strain ATCC 29411 / PCC 7524) TaxID=28072 RepID=UPI00029EC500|nr:hypothetical protein [Nostoc sp. PCC 7524]AFY47355.1 TRAP-type mannitol/chloroaromatic compound transport system, periplasmic component [Nostoc sp. PCC 7524]
MLGELVEVVTKLFEFSDRLKQAEDNKRQRIENYFRSIEQCLRDSAEQLKKNEIPHDKWAELQVYAEELPKTIIDEIGEDKAQEICRLLKITASTTPADASYIQSIEAAAGKFKGLVVTITTGHKPPDSKPAKPPTQPLSFPGFSRRNFMWTSLGTTAGLTAGWLARQNVSMPTVNWKMVSVFKSNPTQLILSEVPQIISERIKNITNGHFRIDIDTTTQIQTEEILKKVHDGTFHCGYSGIYYNDNRYKVLFFGCAIPFGLTPQEQSAWLLYKQSPSDEFTLIQRIYAEKLNLNVIPFPVAATGGQMGGWFKQEVNSVADFNGLTMRIPGLGGEVLRKYFGLTIDKDLPGGAIPIDKIVVALDQGKIQAAEWIGPYDDWQLGLQNVAKYYYYPGWWEPSTTFDMLVNKTAWQQLPLNYKDIFKAVCLETYTKILAKYDNSNSQQLQELRKLEKLGRIKLVRFSDPILQEAENKTNELLKIYSSNAVFKEIYEEWNSFKTRIRDWSNLH